MNVSSESSQSTGMGTGGSASAPGLDLTETYVFLGDGGQAQRVPLTEAFWEELAAGHVSSPEAHLVAHGDGWLVSAYWMADDMASWERHPAGDELIIAQTGSFMVILDSNGGRETVALKAIGSVLVPRGTWHRVTVQEPGLMLFITPSRGTEHRAV